MTSEYDNNEINDTAFPVDFPDESVSLDLFGICVKKEPRDVGSASEVPDQKQSITDLETSETSDVENEVHNSEDFPNFGEDIPDTLPDINDFSIIDPDSFSVTEISDITDDFAEEKIIDAPSVSLVDREQDEIVFEEMTPVSADSNSAVLVSADSNSEDKSTELPEILPAAEVPEYNSVDFDEFFTDSSDDNNASADFPKTADPSVDSSPSLSDVEIVFEEFNPEEVSVHNSSQRIESDMYENSPETDEIQIDQDEFTDIDLSEMDSQSLPSDEDFSSFLDDLNSDSNSPKSEMHIANTGDSGDFDLDSFITTFNETGGASPDEHVKLFDDVQPVDLDLEFDEQFIEDTQRIKATGSAVTESEFSSLEFGVELIDETAPEFLNDESTISFDPSDYETDILTFETDDNNAPQKQSETSLESASEFDEFLSSLDVKPQSIQGNSTDDVTIKPMYDLSVTEDDGSSPVAAPVPESSSGDEEINISLWDSSEQISTEKKNTELVETPIVIEPADPVAEMDSSTPEEFLDIPVEKDYNMTDIHQDSGLSESSLMGESVSLEFDDISAVENELNDFTPETGDATVITNDKSTELLMRIADELSSIKEEISTLKNELAVFKSGVSVQSFLEDQNTEIQHESTGFFTDDDPDEAIALTGDELNNILITADFTEEKSEDSVIENQISDSEVLADSTAILDIEPDSDGLSDTETDSSDEIFSDEISEELAGLSSTLNEIETEDERIDFDNETDIPETLPENFLDSQDATSPFDVEVSHVNSLEEDTSYLEGTETDDSVVEDISIHEPDLEIIDFADEKLEEPALDEFNLDLSDLDNSFPAVQEIPVPAEESDLSGFNILDDGIASESMFTAHDIVTESLNGDIVVNHDIPESPTDELSDDMSLEPDTFSPVEEISADTVDSEPVTVTGVDSIPKDLKEEIKSVLSYMDQLLESLPEEKIEEFARSEHFEVYKKLFGELGIS